MVPEKFGTRKRPLEQLPKVSLHITGSKILKKIEFFHRCIVYCVLHVKASFFDKALFQAFVLSLTANVVTSEKTVRKNVFYPRNGRIEDNWGLLDRFPPTMLE